MCGSDQATMARKIPTHWEESATLLVQDMLDQGILARVEDSISWCSPSIFVEKSMPGKVHLITDFTYLNQFVKRPYHPFLSSEDVSRSINPNTRWLAKYDFLHCYFQLRLDDTSSRLTTTILPGVGRVRYTQAPQGLSCSSDEFNRRGYEIFTGLPWLVKQVDDLLIMGRTKEEVMEHLSIILMRCSIFGVTLTPAKIEVSQDLIFGGMRIKVTEDSIIQILPDPTRLKTLQDFPVPTCKKDLKSFLRLSTTLGKWNKSYAYNIVHLQGLLKEGVEWQWSDNLEQEFQAVKKLLSDPEKLVPFVRGQKTELHTDASRYAIGFILVQVDEEGVRHIITCGSSILTPAQSHYLITELELLAGSYSMEKTVFYLKGIPNFAWVTDHRAIEGIMAKGFHELVNPRHVHLHERMAGFQFHVQWLQGSKMAVPDALSRAPTTTQDVKSIGATIRHVVVRAVKEMDNGQEHLNKMFEAVEDEEYQQLIKAFQDEAVVKNLHSNHLAKAIISIWDSLSLMQTEKGYLLLIDNDRILVPSKARQGLMKALHGGHLGADKMNNTARSRYWWPDIRKDIKDYGDNCLTCVKFKPQCKREEPIASWTPLHHLHPMDEVRTDIWSDGKHKELVIIGRASGFIFSEDISRSQSSQAIIHVFDRIVQEFGLPLKVLSDGGPQFHGPFKEWGKENSIEIGTTATYSSSSNGAAENAVRQVKTLW